MTEHEEIQHAIALMREEQRLFFRYNFGLQMAATGMPGTGKELLKSSDNAIKEVQRVARENVDKEHGRRFSGGE